MIDEDFRVSILFSNLNTITEISNYFHPLIKPKFKTSMKKLLLSASGLLMVGMLSAQTQRLVLTEEFTQASCGPCASQNPAFNALLDANTTKTISLKYQTSWPGFDPMNQQNAAEVATRVSYYGVNGVPWGFFDGASIANDCGAYLGAPACATQTKIDAAYAIPSPFAMSLTHVVSSDLDSAYITLDVTNALASGALPAGNYVLHVAIAETEINFASAPGTNGETDFYMVMRKMLPDASGTAISSTLLTSGANQTFTFNVPLPSYIYNLGQVSVVAFIQENGTKNVLQAAYSSPAPLPSNVFDAGVVSQTTPPASYCANSFTPVAVISNAGANTINSATVSYTINGGTPVTQNYSGTLGAGATATVTFPAATLTGGQNEVVFNVSNVNGGGDYNGMNNTTAPVFVNTLGSTVHAYPFGYDMEVGALGDAPANALLDDQTGRVYIVNQGVSTSATAPLGGNGNSAQSLRYDYYTIAAGDASNLITEKMDLSTLANGKLKFTVAYAQYQGENDQLEVFASTDCGATWTSLYNQAGANLSTAPATTARFYPTAAQWRDEAVDLGSFAGQSEVIFNFKGTSAYGNSMYLDDINVIETDANGNPAAINELEGVNNISVYPNPATSVANVKVQLSNDANLSIRIVDILGKVVYSEINAAVAGSNAFTLNTSNLSNGVYFVEVQSGDVTNKVKLVVKQ